MKYKINLDNKPVVTPLRFILGISLICISLFNRFKYENKPLDLGNLTEESSINDVVGAVNCKLAQFYVITVQSDEKENELEKFLNINEIQYKNITYDSEQGAYFIPLKGYLFTTKENVEVQGNLLQQKFYNYCLEYTDIFSGDSSGVIYTYDKIV